jgi:NADH-quinone oxidoreductase subunit G
VSRRHPRVSRRRSRPASNIPHYCYHPGLSIVASCRLCLMEMKLPHPKTKELGWAPKLFPPARRRSSDGMEVRFD